MIALTSELRHESGVEGRTQRRADPTRRGCERRIPGVPSLDSFDTISHACRSIGAEAVDRLSARDRRLPANMSHLLATTTGRARHTGSVFEKFDENGENAG